MSQQPSYLSDDAQAEAVALQLLNYQEERPKFLGLAFGMLFSAAIDAIAAVAVTALGAWLFDIDRTQQVYVFCAAIVASAIGLSNVKVSDPQVHIAHALKAIAIAQLRRRR